MESSTAPVSTESYSDDNMPVELRGLTPDAIELLRAQQREAIDKATEGLEGDEAIRAATEAKAALAAAYPEYLEAHGVSPGNPHYGDYMDHLQVHSYVNQPDDSMWRVGVPEGTLLDSSRELPISGRDVAAIAFDSFRDRLAAKAAVDTASTDTADEPDARPADTPADTAEADDTPEREETPAEKLGRLRGAYVDAAAARLRAPVYYKRKQRQELTEACEAAQTAYLEQLLAMEGAGLEQMIAAENPDGTKQFTPEQIKNMLMRQINERIQGDEQAIKQAMIEQGGRLHRRFATALEKYANLSTKKKIAVGVGLGAVAAATGFGIGIVAGAAGAAAGAAGAGAVMAGRFGRTYALRLSRLYKKEETPAFAAGGIDRPEYVLGSAQAWMQNRLKGNIESADKTKRSAIKWAVGSVAVGGVIGAATHLLDGGDVPSAAVGKFREVLGWHDDAADSGTVDNVQPPIRVPESAEWELPGEAEVQVPLVEAFSNDALTIRAGEGWYQTFKEVGISREHWADMLNRAGPKLEEMGVAYRAPELGGWGMNMTPDGRMPEEALRYITETAREHGYLPELEVAEVAEVAAPDDVTAEAGPDSADAQPDAADRDGFNAGAVSPENQDMAEIGVLDGDEASAEAASSTGAAAETGGGAAVRAMSQAEQVRFAHDRGIEVSELQAFVKENGHRLHNIRYPDGTPVVSMDYSRLSWRLNAIPEGTKLPESVADGLKKFVQTGR